MKTPCPTSFSRVNRVTFSNLCTGDTAAKERKLNTKSDYMQVSERENAPN